MSTVNITILGGLAFPHFLILIIAKKSEIVNCEYYHSGRVDFPRFLKTYYIKFFAKSQHFS